jgi:hypothetical protein
MPSDHEAEPARRLVLQRVRKRIIEYLELAGSFDEQREYQARVPVHVPGEIINQWEDWVWDARDSAFGEPTFTAAEQNAMARFEGIWNEVAAHTPDPLPNLDALFLTTEWQHLRDAALDALRVFEVRGKLSEDVVASCDPQMPSVFDELLGQLDLRALRCTVVRTNAGLRIDHEGGMQAIVRDVESGFVEVTYEEALHVPAREKCRPETAAQLLSLIFSRTELRHVPVPTKTG